MPQADHGEGGLSRRLTHGAPLAVLLAVGFLTAYQLLPALKAIAVAMLIALVLRTIVNGLERLGAPGWLSVIILVLGIVAFGVLVWFVIVPNLTQEFRVLTSQGRGSLNSLANYLDNLPLTPGSSQLLQRLQGFLSRLTGSLPLVLSTTATVAAGVIATMFLALYLAINPGTYISGLLRLVPRERREGVGEFVERLGRRLRSWLVGMLIIASFVGTAGGVGLWALGVPLPLTFGLIAGFLNVIPYLGSIVGGLLPALLALTISPFKALLVVVLFVAINQVEGNLLQPLIMGHQVRVPEGMILVSFLVMGILVGPIIGALLAAPTAVLVSLLVDELTEKEPAPKEEETREKSRSGG